MLYKNIIKLLENLGFFIKLDENNNLAIDNKKNGNSMRVNMESKKIVAIDYESILIFNLKTFSGGELNTNFNILETLLLHNQMDNSYLEVNYTLSGIILKLGILENINSENLQDAKTILMYFNGDLIFIENPQSTCIYAHEKKDYLSTMSDTNILSFLSENENVLAVINYYSTMYPKILESITSLTESIVSKACILLDNEDTALKRKKDETNS